MIGIVDDEFLDFFGVVVVGYFENVCLVVFVEVVELVVVVVDYVIVVGD